MSDSDQEKQPATVEEAARTSRGRVEGSRALALQLALWVDTLVTQQNRETLGGT